MSTRIPQAEITGLYGAVVKRFSKKLLGRVPEPLGVYWHNRPVLKATMGIGAKAQKWDACDPSLKSFAHMAVAAQIGCSWCLDFGYFQAFNEHLDMDKAREVPRWHDSAVFTPLEREVMGYAEAMTADPTHGDRRDGRRVARTARGGRPGRADGVHRAGQHECPGQCGARDRVRGLRGLVRPQAVGDVAAPTLDA